MSRRRRDPSATAASGASAALSSSPSRKSERATAPTLARRRPQRRTTATRITSSHRPGSAMPADGGGAARRREREHGRPLAVAEEPLPAPGLGAYAASTMTAASATSQRFAWWSGQPAARSAARRAPRRRARPGRSAMLRSRFRGPQLPVHRQVRPYVVPDLSPDRGSRRSEMPPSACVSSLGITHTLFASPCAIWGSTCRYW